MNKPTPKKSIPMATVFYAFHISGIFVGLVLLGVYVAMPGIQDRVLDGAQIAFELSILLRLFYMSAEDND